MSLPPGVRKELVLDLAQLCLDLAGIVDPTPASDAGNLLLSLGRARWFDAVLSGVSMIPYLGDLAKLGRLPRYLETAREAIRAARASAEAAAVLNPILARLARLVDLLPDQLPAALAQLRMELRSYQQSARLAATVGRNLPDISGRFVFKPRWREGSFEYEQIGGRLGVPGKVMTHRDELAQRAISTGTGEHAGHRIAIRFGAPGDARNMSLQNPNMNTYAPKVHQEALQGSGASYYRLEDEWAEKLQRGIGIDVVVRDKYRPGESRPIARFVEWTEIAPNGAVTRNTRDFGNFGSPQQRQAAGR